MKKERYNIYSERLQLGKSLYSTYNRLLVAVRLDACVLMFNVKKEGRRVVLMGYRKEENERNTYSQFALYSEGLS